MYIEYKEYMASITRNVVYVKVTNVRFAINKNESVRFPIVYITLCDVVLTIVLQVISKHSNKHSSKERCFSFNLNKCR